jgi:flavin-dependent dehydrogenase
MPDVIVIGGGPAGSTSATLLARNGYSVVLLERERFPRFQIGESLLPYNNDLFARLGVSDKLVAGRFVPKYGAEFVTGDGTIGCTFRFEQTLPEEYHRSFQVKRSEFDHLLLRNAAMSGVDVREETAVARVDLTNPKRVVVETGNGQSIESRFLVDASGHGSLIGHGKAGRRDIRSLRKIAFFAHYRGAERSAGKSAGNTVIVILQNGWFWMIPLTDDLMSVGLVVDRDHVANAKLQPEEMLARTIADTPFVASRMQNAERVTQVYARRDFSYETKRLVGPNFACVGDAAGFIDPIFSTGVFMAMKSADLATAGVMGLLRNGRMTLLRRYERDMKRALRKYFRFISNFYRREFLEVFLQPKPDFDLLPAIVGVLAGNVFERRSHRWKLALFFTLVRIQRLRRGTIAPPIEWESLPAAASV